MENEKSESIVESFLVRVAAARVAVLFVFHALVFSACYVFANLIRFEFDLPPAFLEETLKASFLVVVGVQLLTGLFFGFYRGWWRYVGIADVVRLVFGLTTSLVLLIGGWYAGV